MVRFEQACPSWRPVHEPEFCKPSPIRFLSWGKRQRQRLSCHHYLWERWSKAPNMFSQPKGGDHNFQITSACYSLLLLGLQVCFLQAHCPTSCSQLLCHCLCFSSELLSHISVLLPFVNRLESVQSAAGARCLPALILCGRTSKLTDGALSSICSVDTSWEGRAWMECSSPAKSCTNLFTAWSI